MDEARRVASNIAKLPTLLPRPCKLSGRRLCPPQSWPRYFKAGASISSGFFLSGYGQERWARQVGVASNIAKLPTLLDEEEE